MKILDAGAYGVICPMINSRAEAEALVRAAKYPPKGYRSFGPVRASIYAGADYAEHANDQLIVMPMIETAEALKNLDEILSTPGVDAIYVGPPTSASPWAASPGWTRRTRPWWKRS
jgi:4-hydroxy-2-oxoheptanedioate aldolase